MGSLNDRSAADVRCNWSMMACRALLLLTGTLMTASAMAVADSTLFTIAAQPMPAALKSFAAQAHMQLLYQYSAVAKATANAVNGDLEKHTALNLLLKDTGLTAVYSSETAATIRPTSAVVPADQADHVTPAEEQSPKEGKSDSSESFRVAQATQGKAATAAALMPTARPPADSSPLQLDEVIVSARKRKESLLNVPVVETVIARSQLENMQTVEISDLPKIVPGLELGRYVVAIGTQVAIRGVGTTTADAGVDSSVSLNIDGLSLGNGLAFESGMFDLQQVEVLKGPQSLFYGKSSPGGVIALHTADPTDQFEVIGRTSYEIEAQTPREEAIISGPVTDTLKLRLASMYSTSEGYFHNVAVATPDTGALSPSYPRGPNSKDAVVRLTALWEPVRQFSARLKVNYVDDATINAEIPELTSCPEGANFAPDGIPFIGGSSCQVSRNYRVVYPDPAGFPGIPNSGVPYVDSIQKYGTLEMNFQPIESLTATSLTAYYALHSNSFINGTESSAAGPAIATPNFYDRHGLTEEIRLNSDFKGPLNFTLGGFYENSHVGFQNVLFGNSAYHLPDILFNLEDPLRIRAYSTFGQIRWNIVPRLELAAGLRWTDETRNQAPTDLSTGVATPIAVAVTRLHSVNNSPEVTLTYKPTDDLTLFGSYKQGYKSGSFTIGTPPPPGSDNSFGDEKVQGAEAGIKTRLLDRRLAVNIAAYYDHFSGLQVNVTQPPVNGIILARTVNAGSAVTYGVDFDASYRPQMIERLQLRGAANWDHARYLTLNNVPCWGGQTIAAGCNQNLDAATGFYTAQNLSGTPMVRAPDWQINAGFDYEIPVGEGYMLVLGNSNAYSSSYSTDPAVGYPNDGNFQKSFVKSDLSLALKSPGERWEFAVIAKDINDKITTGNCNLQNFANGAVLGGQVTGGTVAGPAGISQVGCFMDPGREVWLRLTFRPFASL